MKKLIRLGCFAAALLSLALAANGHWVNKDGFIDYAQHQVGIPPQPVRADGMPDFDQKQDGWHNALGQWNWCGPVAVANCLWWFDSKFEMIKCISLPPGSQVMPPTASDHYSLVSSPVPTMDDHLPQNVIPFITTLGNSLPGGIGFAGITLGQMRLMIENYLSSPAVNLHGHYKITIVQSPTFDEIYRQVEQSQDVIVLLGFWQLDQSGQWGRLGGHYVTVAGVDSQNNVKAISFSDPISNAAEAGAPGIVWNGFLTPHGLPGHPAAEHNDAGNVSHDYFNISASASPGGIIAADEYGISNTPEFWENFQNLNVPDHLAPFQTAYNPNLGVHTELEAILYICPNFDFGDLQPDYPTMDLTSCGPAHPLSEKAWLGPNIDDELTPRILDMDNTFDDGVQFVNLPWWPGAWVQVTVQVSTGPFYAGEPLYLNAWKDGNIDGDFDDGPLGSPEDDFLACDEWVIQDVPVAAGIATHGFCDPGVLDFGPYDLRMRFRLTSQPVGRFGYGGYWGGGVSNGLGTYDIDWVLGEVEDYLLTDMQLPVALLDFEARPGYHCADLTWTTASETELDYFAINRCTVGHPCEQIARIAGRGSVTSGARYSFHDAPLANGIAYRYTLVSVAVDGTIDILADRTVMPSAEILPTSFALAQNHPNPFNASTQISYALPAASDVTLTVYNATGQLVRTLVSARQEAGYYRVNFGSSDLASGVYLYLLKTDHFSQTRKMVLIR
ncbi:MAG: T9SS type A sorting domain-containing protein [bacterium]|nr:T9SS type A sorting domain-containing protein [bacterium]